MQEEPFRELEQDINAVDIAIEKNMHRRMKLAGIRMLWWLVVMAVLYHYYPGANWVHWLWLIPAVSLTVIVGSYFKMKRMTAVFKDKLEQERPAR